MARKNKPNHLSKEYLLKALISLMQTMPYERISITDITSLADVSRMAYYRNYASKDQILTEYIAAIGESVTADTPCEFLSGLLFRLASENLSMDCHLGQAIQNAGLYSLLYDTVYATISTRYEGKGLGGEVQRAMLIGAFCGAYFGWSKEFRSENVSEYTSALKEFRCV